MCLIEAAEPIPTGNFRFNHHYDFVFKQPMILDQRSFSNRFQVSLGSIMSQQSTPTILTPTSSYSHLSTTAGSNPTMQAKSPLSAQQSCKYMQQRIKILERDLEETRLQLFTSEEARADLEARINSDACVEGSARTCHSTEYNGVEQLNYHESILTREEDHQQEISRLHEYYKGVIGQAEETNKLIHEKFAQFNDLSDSIDCFKKRHMAKLQEHERSTNRLKERHEAELEQREGLLQAQHDEENLTHLKDHLDSLKSIQKRYQTAIENTKKEVHHLYMNLGVITSKCRKEELAELQDVFQAELRLINEDYEAEKARTLKYHEAEHQAQVAEFNELLRTHQALVKEHETMRSAHHAEVEAMKLGTYPLSEHIASPLLPPSPFYIHSFIR